MILPHLSTCVRICAFFFLSCFSFSAFPQEQQQVILFTDDFRGNQAAFDVGKYDQFALTRAGITVVRSVKVPPGMKVTLYQQNNFTGKKLELKEDANQKYLTTKGFGQLHHNISIIVATAPIETVGPRVTLYQNNFSGASKSLGPGHYEFSDFGDIDNDQLSSLTIPKGLKVTLYEHSNFGGRKLELMQDASVNELIKNKFNDVTSSLHVVVADETKPEEEPKEVTPKEETPEVPKTKPDDAKPAIDVNAPAVIIYQGDFTGTQKRLAPGRYDVDELGIGNDELSSVDMAPDLRIILYDKEGFKGKSLRLTERTGTQQLIEKGFNNTTSSVVVEEIPRVSVYQGNYGDFAFRLLPGRYDGLFLDRLGLLDNEVSSVQVPHGMSIILYEDDGFKGRAIHLMHNASTDSLIARNFNNVTSSIEVFEELPTEQPELKVTLYANNFTGTSKQLAAGSYDNSDLGIGNNTLSAISIPRGLKVTLYEYGAFEGRSLVLAKSAGPDLLATYGFNDITSSIKVQEIDPEELVVTIYSDKYSGRAQKLGPGRYYARDLTIGDKQLSSIKVPNGMRAILYEEWNCRGVSVILDRDDDFSGSNLFDNYYQSVVVEDAREPVIYGVPITQTTDPAPDSAKVEETEKEAVVLPAEIIHKYDPPCDLSDVEFEDALKAVRAKNFMEEKMAMTKLVTKDKCLTHDQIRAFAREFRFEEQSLEFVQYAYDLAKDKNTFYKLEDIFRFMSTQEKFRTFLQNR